MLTNVTTTPPTTRPQPGQASSAMQITILIAVTWLLLNATFYFLAGYYYDGKRTTAGILSQITDETVQSTRIAFVIYTGTVAAAAIAAVYQARVVTHAIAMLAGVAALVGAWFAFKHDIVATLGVSLLVVGILFALLTWRSLCGSRVAWAFLVALCFTLWLVLSFAAPKIRNTLDVSLWTAFIIPGLLAVAWIGLTMLRFDYRERV
jgi:hypothetical protein